LKNKTAGVFLTTKFPQRTGIEPDVGGLVAGRYMTTSALRASATWARRFEDLMRLSMVIRLRRADRPVP
jgi:hypothetical protein